MSGLLCLQWNNHTSAFLKKFGQLRDKNLYCDATIVCQGKYFKVHRLILSTCSEYFEEIFENIECKHPFIVIKDIDALELEALLNYMYMGEVNVLQDMLPNLIKAAEALRIKGLAVSDEDDLFKSSIDNCSPNLKKRDRLNSSSDSTGTPSKKILKSENSKLKQKIVVEKASESSESINNNQSTSVIKESQEEISNDVKIEPEDFLASNSFLEEPQTQDSLLEMMYGDIDCKSNDENSGNSNGSSVQQPQCSSWDGISGFSNYNQSDDKKDTMWDTNSEPGGLFDTMSPDDQLKTLLEPSKKTSTTLFPGGSTSAVRNCPYCAYRTSRMTHLKRHILCRHTNHRPHQCPYCSYKAVQSWHLQRHMMVHTGEKPFSCPLCPYKSSRNEQLRSHMFRHIKESSKETSVTAMSAVETESKNNDKCNDAEK